ncbi:MAG: hypothetical protein ACI9YT_002276 [Halobacteriales archaeon]|jgi:hypothetical protein
MEHRLLGATHDHALVRERAVGRDVGDVEFRAVPRHSWVIPRQPREPIALGRESGRGVEVVTRGHGLRFPVSIGRDGDERGYRFVGNTRGSALVALHRVVILPDAVEAIAIRSDLEIGVSKAAVGLRFGGERLRFPVDRLPVDPLVVEPGEEDDPVLHFEVAAPVLVNERPDVEVVRDEVHGRVTVVADDHTATVFGRSLLSPVNGIAVERHVSDGDAGAGDHLGGDRGRPGAVSGRSIRVVGHWLESSVPQPVRRV